MRTSDFPGRAALAAGRVGALRAGLLLLLALPAASAAEIEYAVLFRMLDAASGIERYDRLRAVQRIESKRPGVQATDIRMSVRARQGELAVPIATDGQLRFPLSAALLQENPVVSTNQPQGSLTLTLSIELALAPGSKLKAAELLAGLEQVDAMFSARSESAPPRARGVEFHFADPVNGGLTLRGDSERLMLPDGEGRVVLMRDSDLADAAAEIELATAPQQVLPFFGR